MPSFPLIAIHIAQSAAAISAGPLTMPPGRSSSGLCGSSRGQGPPFTRAMRKPYCRTNFDRSRSFCSPALVVLTKLNQLERHRGGLAAADAKARHPALEAALAQCAEQRDQDARARSADRMAKRACAAVDVHLVVRQAVLLHRRHGDHGEGFVDLVQVYLVRRPSRFLEQLPDGTDRRSSELRGFLRMG